MRECSDVSVTPALPRVPCAGDATVTTGGDTRPETPTEEETMSNETDSGTSTNEPSTTDECAGCDVGGLACSIEMYKRQAEVAEESTKALDGYHEKFESARGAYTKARADAKADVEA